MNNYENPNKAIIRLYNEYKQHGKLVIAFDFDNTIYDYHNQGLHMGDVITLLKESKELGHELYCFTANTNEELVKTYCTRTLGFTPKINESSLDHLFGSRKPFYSILLDDRAGLDSTVKLLKELNDCITPRK